MSIEAHLTELSEKHRRLERALAEEMQHAGADDLTITTIKRQKLRLKDEMERLRREAVQMTSH
jgi:hypothetical protein